MGVSFIGILVILVVLGGGAVALGGIVLAAVKGRPGIAALIAALALAVPILLVATAALFHALRSSPAMSESRIAWQTQPSHGESQVILPPSPQLGVNLKAPQLQTTPFGSFPSPSIPNQVPSSGFPGQTTWKISFAPLLFLVFGALALFTLIAKRSFGHAAAGSHGRIWPAFIALPIIALLLFRGVGVHRTTTWSSNQAEQAVVPLHQQNQQNQQQIAIAKLAEATQLLEKQLEKMDIHQLMDRLDAPRIILQAPTSPTAVTAALAVATAQSESPAEEPIELKPETKSNAKSASKHSQKVTTERPVAESVKQVEAVAVSTKVPAEAPEDAGVSPTKTAAKPRPAWIEEPPKRTGPVRREVIITDDYATADECYRAADVYLLFKTYDHVRELQSLPYQDSQLPNVTFQNGMILADGIPIATGRQNPQWIDSRISYLSQLGVGLDYIRREIVAKDPSNSESREFLEKVDRSVGPMSKLYMQMEFTPKIDSQLMEQISAYTRKSRIGLVGFGAASVLMLLTTVWGLLKLDTATKGYYSRWLFVGVPLAIIGGASLLWADPLHMF